MRKATRMSQNVQRQRLTTPTPTNTRRKAQMATRKGRVGNLRSPLPGRWQDLLIDFKGATLTITIRASQAKTKKARISCWVRLKVERSKLITHLGV
jgi:hypothetical protein